MGDCYLLKAGQGKMKAAQLKERKKIERSDGLSYRYCKNSKVLRKKRGMNQRFINNSKKN